MDSELIAQARSDCGHEPEGHGTFVLVANDGGYQRSC